MHRVPKGAQLGPVASPLGQHTGSVLTPLPVILSLCLAFTSGFGLNNIHVITCIESALCERGLKTSSREAHCAAVGNLSTFVCALSYTSGMVSGSIQFWYLGNGFLWTDKEAACMCRKHCETLGSS